MVLKLYGCNKKVKRSDYKKTYTTAADTFKDTCSCTHLRIFEFHFYFLYQITVSQVIIDMNLSFYERVKVYQKYD